MMQFALRTSSAKGARGIIQIAQNDHFMYFRYNNPYRMGLWGTAYWWESLPSSVDVYGVLLW